MFKLILIVALALLAGSCGESAGSSSPGGQLGDEPSATTRGVATVGADLFAERVIGANPGCVTCHSLEPGVTLVGPSLAAVESPVPGLTTAEYIRESILEPDVYLAEGYVAGQMPGGWAELLSAEQIESLVALLTNEGSISE